jgi:hypothetical protein
MVCSVVGEMTSMTLAPDGSFQRPPINSLS